MWHWAEATIVDKGWSFLLQSQTGGCSLRLGDESVPKKLLTIRRFSRFSIPYR